MALRCSAKKCSNVFPSQKCRFLSISPDRTGLSRSNCWTGSRQKFSASSRATVPCWRKTDRKLGVAGSGISLPCTQARFSSTSFSSCISFRRKYRHYWAGAGCSMAWALRWGAASRRLGPGWRAVAHAQPCDLQGAALFRCGQCLSLRSHR